MLVLTLGVNSSTEIHAFLSIINASINMSVNADLWCDYIPNSYQTVTNSESVHIKTRIYLPALGITIFHGNGNNATDHGRISVTKYGIRGKICGAHWDDNAANVVCRQMVSRSGFSQTHKIGNIEIICTAVAGSKGALEKRPLSVLFFNCSCNFWHK